MKPLCRVEVNLVKNLEELGDVVLQSVVVTGVAHNNHGSIDDAVFLGYLTLTQLGYNPAKIRVDVRIID